MSYIPINPAGLFDSPVFTGDPRAPTPIAGDSDTSVATTAFVTAAVVAGGAFVDAPSDGSLYGRQNAAWLKAAPLASPGLTGNPTAPTPTAGDNGISIATTAFVATALASGGGPPPATVPPLMDGAAAVGTTTKYAREDHRHPTDTSLAPLDSPVFTGDPRAPTATSGDNDTSIATTAFVADAVANAASGGTQVGEWTFNTTTTAPPASGQIRLNNASQSLATHVYVSCTTAPGVDATNFLKFNLKSGSKILLQNKTDATKYVVYTLSADAVVASGYADATIVFSEIGAALPAQRTLMAVAVASSGGGISDAPSDGKVYGRLNAAWTDVNASPAFAGTPTAPTAIGGTSTTQLATTAFVQAAVSAGGTFVEAPVDGSLYGRLNAGWTKAAPLTSPVLTGTPAAPTATGGTNSTQIATTAFVQGELTAKAPLASPVFTGNPTAPTATAGDNDTSIATTAFVTGAITTAGAGYQPLDADLTAIAALAGTNNIYYRSASNTWSSVTIGTGLSFSAGTLANTVSGVTPAALTKTDDTNVTLTLGGTPATALLQASSLTLGWTGTLSTTRGGLGVNAGASTGVPLLAAGTTTITATTGTGNIVRAVDPALTGTPTAITAAPGTNTTQIATTAFVTAAIATVAPDILSSTWLAGANPHLSTIFIASRAMTITNLVGVVDVANGATATVSVMKAASGTALSAGTVIHSGSFNANGTASTNQTLTLTVTTLAIGDRLGLVTTGTFTNSVASISVTVT